MLPDLLRSETRRFHDQLEQSNPLPASTADLVSQLTLFHGFIAPWEKRLVRLLPPDDPIVQGRLKTAWLEADLAHFGLDGAAIAALPVCTELPDAGSRAALLGAAYVLEGSTLGGQLISGHLERTLGLSDGGGYRFYRSYGPEVRARWQAFREELLRASSPETDPVIIRAACDTFRRLHAWFATRNPLAA